MADRRTIITNDYFWAQSGHSLRLGYDRGQTSRLGQMETLLANADTMIVPLYCTNCDPEKWVFELASVMTAVAGGLIMARWRDLLLVALIGFLSVWFGEIARASILERRFAYETARELFDPMNTLLWFAYFLVIAALVQAAQRGVVWLRSLR